MANRKNKSGPTRRKPHKGSPARKSSRTRRVWLNILPQDLWLRVQRGTTIWEALQDTDVELAGDCGGLGKCGKCKVRVMTSIGFPPKKSRTNLSEAELRQGIRLACRTRVSKDLIVQTEETDPEQEYVQILKTGERPLFPLDPLVEKQVVKMAEDLNHGDLTYLERLKFLLGPESMDVQPSLYCLRALPQMMSRSDFHGAVVWHHRDLLTWLDWEDVERCFGLTLDLGTSTLVGKLINLADGSEVAAVSRLNSQIKYGSNVISRLKFIREHPDGLRRLFQMLVGDINRIVSRLMEVGEIGSKHILAAVAVGNTSMQHLLLGVDPSAIAEAPFAPVIRDGFFVRSADLGLDIHPEAPLYMMPSCSGYVGGDLVAGMLTSGAAEQEEQIVLGLDLGTNGEIFLGNRRRMLTCSAAAGPAFEGGNISQGMIARAGAIEGVYIEDDRLGYRIVGNIKPVGLCGSGLVDLVAVLLHAGVIDREGLIRSDPGGAPPKIASRVVRRGEVFDYLVAPAGECFHNKPIHLTQADVRELQLAKGAVAAGIKTLMDELGVGILDIGRVVLTGALGNYVKVKSAMRIGLLPRFDREIVQHLGNAASTGANMALLSRAHWKRANQLAGFAEHLELSTRADFNQTFVEQLDFPDENMW